MCRLLSHGHKFVIRKRLTGKVIALLNARGLGLHDIFKAKRADIK